MIYKIFSVYDVKAEAYARPFFAETRGVALRSFQDIANDPNHQIGKYPSDYTLFEIGQYNDQSGELVNAEANVALGAAIEFVKEKRQPIPYAEMAEAL